MIVETVKATNTERIQVGNSGLNSIVHDRVHILLRNGSLYPILFILRRRERHIHIAALAGQNANCLQTAAREVDRAAVRLVHRHGRNRLQALHLALPTINSSILSYLQFTTSTVETHLSKITLHLRQPSMIMDLHLSFTRMVAPTQPNTYTVSFSLTDNSTFSVWFSTIHFACTFSQRGGFVITTLTIMCQ